MGYTFTGWSLERDGSDGTSYTGKLPVATVNDLCLMLIDSGENMLDLYAQWEANTYTVIFNGNGGEPAEVRVAATYDEKITIRGKDPALVRTGYTLKGWDADADEATVEYQQGKKPIFNAANFPMLETAENGAEITLNAVWKANKYTVTFHNGEAEPVVQEFVYDVEQALAANTVTKENGTFRGWATTRQGNVVYTDKEVVKNLTTVNNGNVDLYAAWNAWEQTQQSAAYKVEHYFEQLNGEYVLDETATQFPVFGALNAEIKATDHELEKTGYHLNTEKSASVVVAMPTDPAEGETMPGFTTLKIYYALNEYTVTFDSNYGSAVDTQTVKHGAKAYEPTKPTKSGYTFAGWYLDKTKYDFDTAVTGDITLKAEWNFIWVDYGNVVTFKDDTNYDLTAQPGTTKNTNGDVMVSGVSGIIAPNRIPTVTGSDAYYDQFGWAIKDANGNLELIDLATYKFTRGTVVYAVMQDVWPTYLDMKQDRTDWFYTYVRDLSIGSIVNGYDGYIFKAAGNVTWGEALKLIMLATGYEAQAATDKHWASGYLAKAEIDGLVEIGSVTDLNKAITREEYAKVASKAMKLQDVTIETPFADTEEQAILNLYAAKIVEGSFDVDGNRLFKPDDLITRAEISTVIWRINNYYKTTK